LGLLSGLKDKYLYNIVVFNFLNSTFSKDTPKPRSLYAFTKYRRGDFVLFIDDKQGMYEFMQLPDLFQVYFTTEEFKNCIENKLLDFVECLPQDVFDVCIKNIKNLA
jgi:hypothetical protein